MTLHPSSPCTAATEIAVAVARPRPCHLDLRYAVTGNIAGLRMPERVAPERIDGLWRHTCFEAFVQASPGGPYYEFNFAPSTRWAAYRFDSYRGGMTVADGIGAPGIEVLSHGARYELRAAFELRRVPDLPGDAAWRLGLSAVIEEVDGTLSYWALAHPPGRPDFHQSDCFTLELPAA